MSVRWEAEEAKCIQNTNNTTLSPFPPTFQGPFISGNLFTRVKEFMVICGICVSAVPQSSIKIKKDLNIRPWGAPFPVICIKQPWKHIEAVYSLVVCRSASVNSLLKWICKSRHQKSMTCLKRPNIDEPCWVRHVMVIRCNGSPCRYTHMGSYNAETNSGFQWKQKS